jgi:hypothetical protein
VAGRGGTLAVRQTWGPGASQRRTAHRKDAGHEHQFARSGDWVGELDDAGEIGAEVNVLHVVEDAAQAPAFMAVTANSSPTSPETMMIGASTPCSWMSASAAGALNCGMTQSQVITSHAWRWSAETNAAAVSTPFPAWLVAAALELAHDEQCIVLAIFD